MGTTTSTVTIPVTGVDAMLAVAIKGKGAMPPKGACAACTDDDLKAAIEYMVSQSK